MIARLRRDPEGAIAIEFALLAPVLVTMMVGVFQVAVYLQNYNAVRSVAVDAGRYIMIQYQKGNDVVNDDIQSVVRGVAVNTPYMLDTDRLQVTASTASTSRIVGAKEIDLTINYTLEDWLPFVNLPATTISYSRPVFVVPS